MKKKKINRSIKFFFAFLLLIMFWASGFLVVQSFKDNLEYYFTPTDILNNNEKINHSKKIRIGGLIIKNSIKREIGKIEFQITDFNHQVKITYLGTDLPPIFREEVGIIARGHLIDNNNFTSDQLIGKHDENYKPISKKKLE